MKLIAITGGIGSGKSAVSAMLEELGAKVLYCDKIYAELLDDAETVRYISKEMNVEPIQKCGKTTLNRKKISELVFSDRAALEKLNGITHPLVLNEIFARANSNDKKTVFVEIPLLFEGGYEKHFDGIIIVTRKLETRLAAIMKRDGLTEEEATLRIKSQTDYENFLNNGHTIIYNDGSLADLKEKVAEIYEKFYKEDT